MKYAIVNLFEDSFKKPYLFSYTGNAEIKTGKIVMCETRYREKLGIIKAVMEAPEGKNEQDELIAMFKANGNNITEPLKPITAVFIQDFGDDTSSCDEIRNTRTISQYYRSDVEKVTLLSLDEWNKTKEIKGVPIYRDYFWLRSAYTFDSINFWVVTTSGGSTDDSASAAYGVAPCFIIPNLKAEIGTKVFVENTLCTVIDKGKAFSDILICEHRIHPRACDDFEKSEMNSFLNSGEFWGMV